MGVLRTVKYRWDSSDPDRAPPPLPLNPGSGSPTTKANTSAGIAAAAKQIVDKTRESAPMSSFTSNQTPQTSPERSLIKGVSHKRLQSLQTGSVKDLRNYLDNHRSPDRSPERPGSRSSLMLPSRQSSADDLRSTPDRSSTPTPTTRDPLKDTPTLRPSARPPPRAILGENTPPSATMLALQTMQVSDSPFNDVTNNAAAPGGGRRSSNNEFSRQLSDLTSIATNLQREMAQLSRRSKDNATDLVSLKEATNARDEDIRKSLRELATSVHSTQNLLSPPPPPPLGSMNRSTSAFSLHGHDNLGFSTPPSGAKSFALPRAVSAHGFLEESRGTSPLPYSMDSAASVAMLEKIIREMVTKEGQERLLSTLSELLEKSRKENSDAAKKVEQLSEFIKEKSESQALVPARAVEAFPPKLDLNLDSPRDLFTSDTTPKSKAHQRTADDEILKILQRLKDSITLSGGTTAEVKGLVRDLRGEVLGMGRALGKRLDQINETQANNTTDRSIEDGQGDQHAEEVQRIIEDGLAELKDHLSSLLQQRAEQDDHIFKQLATTQSNTQGEDMLAVIEHALDKHGSKLERQGPPTDDSSLDREGVLDAVKEGLKDFEPNIELQQFGLERDEILAVLKEGLEEYQNDRPEPGTANIDKGELFEVMQEALKDFQAPFPIEKIGELKHEILENVRQALDDVKAQQTGQAFNEETIRTLVLQTVREGIADHGPAAPREMEISRNDLFDAVKASLDGSTVPFGGFGEQVLKQLRDLVDDMRVEFKQYSAANGRDTEQVLDAMKDGLESLRSEVETYVDRAQDVTGKDEIVETFKMGLEQLRVDVQSYCNQSLAHEFSKNEMLEYIKAEFEHLHETVGTRDLVNDDERLGAAQTAEIMQAIRQEMCDLREHIGNKSLDGESDEDLNMAMKVEFEQLRAAILNASASDKNELIETIQDSMGVLHAKLNGSEIGSISSGSFDDLVQTMRAELSVLKETIHAMIGDVDTDAIVSRVRQSIEDLRVQLSADQSDAAAEALGTIKEEMELFKESMGSSLVRNISAEDSEVLQAIQRRLDDLKDKADQNTSVGMTDDMLEALRGEFEILRNSIANGNYQSRSDADMLDALRLGLDDLRSHLEKKLDNPEATMSHQNHMLDALNEGLEDMRTDILKTLNKPLDMTVNYEILDTLKDGLDSLRAKVDKLTSEDSRSIAPRSGEIVLADGGEDTQSREIPTHKGTSPDNASKHDDTGKIEVLITQLQIKIEALNQTVQDIPIRDETIDTVAKQDIAKVEALLEELQHNVADIASGGHSTAEGVAMKVDTDAIETLVRNTKAQLDEMVLPDAAAALMRENLDEIQAVVRTTNEAIESLADKLENSVAAKTDVAVVELLAHDLKTSVDELKESLPSKTSPGDKLEEVTKADLDILGVLCTEIKTRVNEMALLNLSEMPSKADIDQLQELVADFRESHEKMCENYETDIGVTARAFDDRKREFEDTINQITVVKALLDEAKIELLDRVGDGAAGIEAIEAILKGIEEKPHNDDVIAEVKEAMEKVKDEFERTHSSLEAIKVDHAQSAESALEKQSEHRDAVVSQLEMKLDTLFDMLMAKYDDAQLAAEEKAKVMSDKSTQQEELLKSTQAMADDLKLSIDTLGTALTSFMGDFPSTFSKLADESSTIFAQVVDTHNKLEETTEGLKGEHNATREEVAKVLAAIDGVQSDLMEHNPRFIMTLEEVRAMIKQHYEHSQRTADAAAEHAKAVKDLQDQLRAGFEAQTDGLKSQNEELKTALPALLPPTSERSQSSEEYDSTRVHVKLDRLLGHVEEAATRSSDVGRLDEIHEKVIAAAAEVSAFVSAQNQQLTERNESREKEAGEIALLLERRSERKDQLEADITVLNEEKESLQHAIQSLKIEKEALAAQKARINADVSSLETALSIRRDELHAMDNRAAAIEKRMLDGVMNQSRMLLLGHSAKPPSPKKKKNQGRDLRIPSDTSAASAQTVTSSVPGLRANHTLAMNSRLGLQRNGAMANTTERRIMSLNQINHNVPTGAHAFSIEKPILGSLPQSLKRSHSVKTCHLQKTWAAKRHASLATHDKENDMLSEENEGEESIGGFTHPESPNEEDLGSEITTERRTSYFSHTDGSMSYATGSYLDYEPSPSENDRRVSNGTSDLTYSSNSYMTGSELDRRGSYSSSAHGVVGVQSVVSPDESKAEDDAPHEETEPAQLEPLPEVDRKALFYAPPSDSGLGTDLPTALMSGGEEYFD